MTSSEQRLMAGRAAGPAGPMMPSARSTERAARHIHPTKFDTHSLMPTVASAQNPPPAQEDAKRGTKTSTLMVPLPRDTCYTRLNRFIEISHHPLVPSHQNPHCSNTPEDIFLLISLRRFCSSHLCMADGLTILFLSSILVGTPNFSLNFWLLFLTAARLTAMSVCRPADRNLNVEQGVRKK